ncbi:MAG: DUF167 domain-containing protein [bacterium]|nr:DUF167 domain-containing protein [bacterium]
MTESISLIVKTGARENAVSELDGKLVVRVKAHREKGKANNAVLRILSEHLKVPVSSLSLVSGKTSSRKIVRVVQV